MALPPELNKDNTLFFPEASMTTREQLSSGKPSEFHIVTDSPFLVSLYGCDEVYYWSVQRQKWVNPNFQTRACSYGRILMSELFDARTDIPTALLDGKTTNVMGYEIK
jgi:hypothetical protein